MVMKNFFFLLLFLGLSSAVVLNESVQTFTKTVTPLSCSVSDKTFTVWRELDVKEMVYADAKGNKASKFVSTITVHVRNDAGVELTDVEFRELIPDSVAKNPQELFNFTLRPELVEKGSVVVSFLFDNVKPGEVKNFSYSVEKKVDEKALSDFKEPEILLKKKQTGAQAGSDLILPGVVVFLFVIAAFVGWKSFSGSF